MSSTFGPAYDQAQDGERVTRQHLVIKSLMLDARKYFTLKEISDLTSFPESSISAQLRHLRKERFGGYTVEKRRRMKGTWEYLVSSPIPEGDGQLSMFE